MESKPEEKGYTVGVIPEPAVSDLPLTNAEFREQWMISNSINVEYREAWREEREFHRRVLELLETLCKGKQ
jgi:hypothetical protein